MATPIWMTGFGAQSLIAASQYQLWNTSSGDVTIDSTVLRGGRPTLRVNSTTTLGARITKVYPGTPGNVIVFKRVVRLEATPATTQVEFFQFTPTVGYSLRIGYNSGKFRARFGSGQVGVNSTLSWVPGAFHVVEGRVNMGVSPMTLDWRIDGVEQSQLLDAGGQAASTVASTTFGPPGADQVILNFADVVDSATSADYPLEDSSVIALMPTGGTAVGTSNSFEWTTNGTSYTPIPTGATNVASWLSDQPTTTATSFVRQAIAGAGNYLEVPFTSSTATSIRAVRAILAYGTEVSGTANTAAAVIMRGGTEVPILGSSSAPVNYSTGGTGPKYADVIVPPPVGGWTLSDLNALTARIGFSTDVSPQPRWFALLLEVDVLAAGGTTPVSQILRPASITGSSGTWTGTAADLAETVPDDTTVVVSPPNPVSGVYEEVKLGAGVDPGTTSGHILHIRRALQGPGPMGLTVELRNGTSVVATWTYPSISTSYVQTDEVLTASQAAACAPYTDLRLRFYPNYVTAPQPPAAALTLTRVDGRTVTADWSGSSATTGSLVSATVNWGDGSNTYTWPGTQTAQHIYPVTPIGNRTVTVTVTDSNGLTASDSGVFSVQSATPPTLGLARTRIDENSVTVDVSGSTAGSNPIARHEVTWGDGTGTDTLTEPTRTRRHDYAATPTGFKTITATVYDTAGLSATGTIEFEVQAVATTNVIIYAVGDISAAGTKQTDDALATAIQGAGDADYVVTLGDNQYPDGTLSDFNTYFDASFGRFGSKLVPCPGNHDYHTAPFAAGYRQYMSSLGLTVTQGSEVVGGVTVYKNFYHRDVGNWRILMLDSELTANAGTTSVGDNVSSDQAGVTEAMEALQMTWLDARLAEMTGTGKGLIACWHRPRYCSDSTHGSAQNTSDTPYQFTSKLITAKCDLILNGHVHVYERFDKMNNAGAVDATNGVRNIVVGTGGLGGSYALRSGGALTGSLKQFSFGGTDVYGALKLTLGSSTYSGTYFRSGGATASDSFGPFNITTK